MEKYDLTSQGGRLRFARTRLHLTQEQLAEKAGYTGASSIRQFETGIRSFGRKPAGRMAAALGVSAEWLLCLTDDMQSLAGVDFIDMRKEPDGYYNILQLLTGEPFYYTFVFTCVTHNPKIFYDVPLHNITQMSRINSRCCFYDQEKKGHEGTITSVTITNRNINKTIPYSWFATAVDAAAGQMKAAIDTAVTTWEQYRDFT